MTRIEEVEEIACKIINGQEMHSLDIVSFGWSNLADAGCGVIATHNAMILSGRESDVREVASYYAHKSRFRFFGVMPLEIGEYLDDNSIPYTKYKKQNESMLWSDLQNGGVAIVSFWNEMVSVGFNSTARCVAPNLFSGAHTVAITYSGGKYCVYNAYSNRDTAYYYSDITDYIAGGYIDGYYIPVG